MQPLMWHRGQKEWCLVHDQRGCSRRWGEAKMADVEEKEAMREGEDVTMTETENTTASETQIGTQTEMGALAAND